ncbi:ATP-binding protein [Euzebya sp.]|uniref:sensor histidine kinase n=1 Tax=Euzebya sp. TaxID=1971409 RepID=UPI00351746BB
MTTTDAQRLARTAGLKDLRLPHLEEVDRRRAQLWALSLFVALVLPAVMVVSGLDGVESQITDVLEIRNVRLGLLAMLVVVLGYVAEREVTLRRLTALLVEERVLTASLVNRVDELNLLLRATRAMNSALDLDAVLDQIADSTHTLLRAGGVSIMLVDAEDPEVLAVAAIAGDPGVSVGRRQAIGDGLAGGAVARRDALLIGADDDQPRARHHRGGALVVPMEVRGQLVGVISVTAGGDREPFTEFDLRGVSVFADAAAAAISNARAYEQQLGRVASLLEQDRAKNEFLTLVTHELRTPLTSMIGLMTLMAQRGEEMEPAKVAEYAEIARSQGWRLDRLIENLLESSRTMRGALDITLAPADVGAEIDKAAVGLQRALPDHPITVTAPAGILRQVDMDAILRIIDNLLSNAAKYTPAGTPIDVRLGETATGLVVTVADHGPGLAPEDKQALFEKFTRGPDPYDRGGLGLGLFVVRALAEAHGGRVEIDDTPGGGATFRVWLTAERVEDATPAG